MKKININDGWEFIKCPEYAMEDVIGSEICVNGDYEKIDLPHTWFAPENPYAGTAIYRKTLELKPERESVYIEFEGVEQRCIVYVNGIKAGEHQGSYATFRVKVPDEILDDNTCKSIEIVVVVNNEKSDDLAPMFGDFTIFGGIYRNVSLIYVSQKSFDYLYYGTNGIIVRAGMKDKKGVLSVEPHVTSACINENAGESGKEGNKKLYIRYDIQDPDLRTVIENHIGDLKEAASFTIDDASLWDGKGKSRLYTIKASLEEEGDNGDLVIHDSTEVSFGFRNIEITPDKGLFLNGRTYKLCGVAKHQDFGSSYNAVSDEQIKEDFELISEIGANAVRLSHYQHPQLAYNICDEKGLLVWAEIPMLKMTAGEKLFESTCEQLRELILQNIHHPSIYCWGIQNEIAMFRDDEIMHDRCRKLSDMVHELDPGRCSSGANLYSVKPASKMNEVSDIVGYNLYFGWYYGQMEDYRQYLDRLHETKPNVPYGISEYGVDTNIGLHSENPHVKDYSEEYQALFHESVYPILEEKKYLWGSFVWNMFDFSSAIRNEGGVKGINQKGLVSSDRKIRKDAFYYYKAKWSEEKVLHICSKRFEKRAGDKITIKVYSNLQEAELFVNNVSCGKSINSGNSSFVWENIALSDGSNEIKVVSGDYEDSCIFMKVDAEPEEYALPADPNGGMVKNWFLDEDSFVKEGFLSVNSRADEIIGSRDGAELVKELFPDLYKVMTEQDVIPLGLEFLSILKRQLGGAPDAEEQIKKINEKLNTIKEQY